jgi:hypothetical protein
MTAAIHSSAMGHRRGRRIRLGKLPVRATASAVRQRTMHPARSPGFPAANPADPPSLRTNPGRMSGVSSGPSGPLWRKKSRIATTGPPSGFRRGKVEGTATDLSGQKERPSGRICPLWTEPLAVRQRSPFTSASSSCGKTRTEGDFVRNRGPRSWRGSIRRPIGYRLRSFVCPGLHGSPLWVSQNRALLTGAGSRR